MSAQEPTPFAYLVWISFHGGTPSPEKQHAVEHFPMTPRPGIEVDRYPLTEFEWSAPLNYLAGMYPARVKNITITTTLKEPT